MYASTSKDESANSLKNSAQNIGNEAREAAGDVKDDLRATANKAGRKVRNFIDTATDDISHATDTVSARIHDKPLQSSLIALGLGFVLGALFRR